MCRDGAINEEGTSGAPRIHQRMLSICDLETFAERIVLRLSKIVPAEFISYNGVNPRIRRNIFAPYPQDAFDDVGLSPSLVCLASVRFLLDMLFNSCQRLTACDKSCQNMTAAASDTHQRSFTANSLFGFYELTLTRSGAGYGAINEEGTSGAPRIHQRMLSHL